MTTITAKSIAASCLTHAPSNRIDTILARYPRWIHSEFMTHRVLSRNASSSRAIPVEKLIQSAIDDPAMPLHWGANQPGMQAHKELEGDALEHARDEWDMARLDAIEHARRLARFGAHKQIVNRILEPFTHITVVMTGTDWDNFFDLRCHPDAEPHMRMLAEAIQRARHDAEVQPLTPGEWHMPFVATGEAQRTRSRIALSVARSASTSYKTVEGFDMTLLRATALFDKLANAAPIHASPFEHQAQADAFIVGRGFQRADRRGNFAPGWVQLRQIITEVV